MKLITKIGNTPSGYIYSNGLKIHGVRKTLDKTIPFSEALAKPYDYYEVHEDSCGDSNTIFTGTEQKCIVFILNFKK